MATTFRSFAKINLHLEVVRRLDDGYHELRTIFQTISLHDRLEVALGGRDVELELTGREVAAGESNLAHRAASAFLDRFGGAEGVHLRLDKRVPVGGGLGGGSSNAATVLLALRELCGRPEDLSELVEIAASLGADVPYFLVGGTALGLGRGDRIESLPDLAEEELLLVSPPGSVSTREVFESGLVGPGPGLDPVVDAVRGGHLERPSEVDGRNDLEAAAMAVSPEMRAVYTALVLAGAKKVRVSGSGGTMFLFRSQLGSEREPIGGSAPGARILEVRTLSRSSLRARRVVNSLGGA